MYDFPFTIRDVCDLEGIRLPNDGRANYTVICPSCGKRALTISAQKNNFHCFACDESGGVLQLYVLCENSNASLSEARKEILARLFGTGYYDEQDREDRKRRMEARKKAIKEDEVPQSTLRNEEELDRTNTELLNLLGLAQDHYENLIHRGLTEENIAERKYKSFPLCGHTEIPLKLMEEGLYIDGIPGFYRNDFDKWELVKMKRGIMIPIVNHHNRICGFQIRKDNNLLKEDEKKFTWLSSRGKKYGTSVPGSIHYACDFEPSDGIYIPKLSHNKGIVLTEGPLKADIFYGITKYPAMAVPGVSCQTQLEKELDFLKENGFETIYNAYDMDYLTNKNVYRALKNSYESIIEKGFRLKRLVWNDSDKGLDDHYSQKYRKYRKE